MGTSTVVKKCVPISVSFQVLTDDQLRQIIFGLTKGCNPDDTAFWIIHFQLQERADTNSAFVDRVKLDVTVGQDNHDNAQKTADNSLNDAQTNHLLGPVQQAADLKAGGQIGNDELGGVVEDTLPLA